MFFLILFRSDLSTYVKDISSWRCKNKRTKPPPSPISPLSFEGFPVIYRITSTGCRINVEWIYNPVLQNSRFEVAKTGHQQLLRSSWKLIIIRDQSIFLHKHVGACRRLFSSQTGIKHLNFLFPLSSR